MGDRNLSDRPGSPRSDQGEPAKADKSLETSAVADRATRPLSPKWSRVRPPPRQRDLPGPGLELRTYLAILWRRKWAIAVTTVVTFAVVVIGTLLMTPTYEASTTLRAATAPGGTVDYTHYMYAERLINTYAEIALSGPVLEELARVLGLKEPPEIKVEALPNTELIEITVEDPNPDTAREAANVLAEILVAQSTELYSGGAKSAQEILGEQLAQVEEELNQARSAYEGLLAEAPEDDPRISAARQSISVKEQTYATLLREYDEARIREALRASTLSVVEPAVAPLAPSKPRVALNVALGFLVGLAGGVGLAFLFENLDSTLYTTHQIAELTQLPILAAVPAARTPRQSAFFDGNSPQAEAFRRLRSRLAMLGHGTASQTWLVTSAQPHEGKSTVVANLALAIAHSGKKVVIVDADLRRPNLHRFFRLSNKLGLSSILRREVQLREAVQNREIPPAQAARQTDRASWSKIWRRLDWLDVLCSGPPVPNPVDVLSSSKMTALLEQLAGLYDVVLLDAPSLVAVADAAVLAPAVDGVLLVVGRTRARRESVQTACQQLAEIQANCIGVVVNLAEADPVHDYYRHPLAPGDTQGDGSGDGRGRVSARDRPRTVARQ